MAAETQQLQGAKTQVNTSIGTAWETITKTVATIAAVVYVCGFLIISLFHSSYGFAETNPFKPRILSAGAWFLLLTAVPVVVVSNGYPRSSPIDWLRLTRY